MTRNEAKALRNTVIQGKMAELCGGIVKKKEQSDKYGYDLDTYYIGNEIIKKHYVKKNKNKFPHYTFMTWGIDLYHLVKGFFSLILMNYV